MTLLISWFLISGFDMSFAWYFITIFVWIMHLIATND